MSKVSSSWFQEYTIFKRNRTNVMYLMYLALGGAVFDSSCHPTIRRIYFTLESYAIIFSSVSGIPCMYDALFGDRLDLAYLLAVVGCCCLGPAMLMQTLTTYLCRKNFRKALKLMDHNFYVRRGGKCKNDEYGILQKKMKIK